MSAVVVPYSQGDGQGQRSVDAFDPSSQLPDGDGWSFHSSKRVNANDGSSQTVYLFFKRDESGKLLEVMRGEIVDNQFVHYSVPFQSVTNYLVEEPSSGDIKLPVGEVDPNDSDNSNLLFVQYVVVGDVLYGAGNLADPANAGADDPDSEWVPLGKAPEDMAKLEGVPIVVGVDETTGDMFMTYEDVSGKALAPGSIEVDGQAAEAYGGPFSVSQTTIDVVGPNGALSEVPVFFDADGNRLAFSEYRVIPGADGRNQLVGILPAAGGSEDGENSEDAGSKPRMVFLGYTTMLPGTYTEPAQSEENQNEWSGTFDMTGHDDRSNYRKKSDIYSASRMLKDTYGDDGYGKGHGITGAVQKRTTTTDDPIDYYRWDAGSLNDTFLFDQALNDEGKPNVMIFDGGSHRGHNAMRKKARKEKDYMVLFGKGSDWKQMTEEDARAMGLPTDGGSITYRQHVSGAIAGVKNADFKFMEHNLKYDETSPSGDTAPHTRRYNPDDHSPQQIPGGFYGKKVDYKEASNTVDDKSKDTAIQYLHGGRPIPDESNEAYFIAIAELGPTLVYDVTSMGKGGYLALLGEPEEWHVYEGKGAGGEKIKVYYHQPTGTYVFVDPNRPDDRVSFFDEYNAAELKGEPKKYDDDSFPGGDPTDADSGFPTAEDAKLNRYERESTYSERSYSWGDVTPPKHRSQDAIAFDGLTQENEDLLWMILMQHFEANSIPYANYHEFMMDVRSIEIKEFGDSYTISVTEADGTSKTFVVSDLFGLELGVYERDDEKEDAAAA